MHYGERAKVDLARLVEGIREAGLEALDEGAEFMVGVAQGYVRVDTGTLQSSIRKENRGDIVSVVAGGMAYVNPRTRRGCDYASAVESRYPYLRPAFETVRNYIKQLITDKVVQTVER